MKLLARAVIDKRSARAIVAATFLVCGVALLFANEVEHDDDLLAFLPEDNADVALFQEINTRFGGLDVALVGIDAPDLFTTGFLTKLQATTEALDDLEFISHAMSIANLEDVSPDPEAGGIQMAALVDAIPQSPEEEEALRERVMSRDHVVGNLVSRDGDAVLIYCFTGHGADPKIVAEQVRTIVLENFDEGSVYWGGSPFISTWIYTTTQADMARLTPWSIAAIVLILLITFRDAFGVLISLLSTGMGIAAANGAMGLFDVEFNIVLSSMPVLLFALGSAYSIHMLARYYALEPEYGCEEALRRTVIGLGPVVLAAGGTTVAGLLSFIAMDIAPMRSFGLFTAMGIASTLILSVTFVPAVIRLMELKGRKPGLDLSGPTVLLVEWCRRRRGLILPVLLIAALGASTLVTTVKARMDNAAFFNEGSPPDLADRFLAEEFGGSTFIQIPVKGDFKQPVVQRQLRYMADVLRNQPHVTQAIHIADTLGIANEAMEGVRRVPDTPEKVALLLGFMTGNKGVGQMVDDDRTEALITLKLDTADAAELEAILANIEERVAALAVSRLKVGDSAANPTQAALVLQAQTLARLRALSRDFDAPMSQEVFEAIKSTLGTLDASPDPAIVQARIAQWMGSDENFAELPPERPDFWGEAAAAIVAEGGPLFEDSIREVLVGLGLPEDSATIDDLGFSLEVPLEEAWAAENTRAAADALIDATGLKVPGGNAGQRFRARVAAALADLDAPTYGQPVSIDDDGFAISQAVNGLPVLYRGLSASVTANQFRSLGLALGLVLIIMILLFRSPLAGLLATTPTVLTLLFVYGGMGWLGVTLDIGTSMLASLIIGAGVDYAVHLVSAWQGQDSSDAGRRAAESTAVSIWANALMVAAGFFVLTLGEARPLQNVGGLTAAAMMIAALTTFVAIPALARARSYRSGEAATLALPSSDLG
jgi:uncharacterized protein